jgi:hypothetical protein
MLQVSVDAFATVSVSKLSRVDVRRCRRVSRLLFCGLLEHYTPASVVNFGNSLTTQQRRHPVCEEEHAFEDFAVSLQEVCLYCEGGGPDMVGKPAVELPSVFPSYDGRFLWWLNPCGGF